MRPILDGMQTMPSFVYLVPGILFFSLGNVPAVMVTVIYAVPPVIRLTNLGIRQVSAEAVEAARSFGTTPLQLLTKVQVPLALPTIMAGINQTTMMALAMVVVGSLVGAGGIGNAVLRRWAGRGGQQRHRRSCYRRHGDYHRQDHAVGRSGTPACPAGGWRIAAFPEPGDSP